MQTPFMAMVNSLGTTYSIERDSKPLITLKGILNTDKMSHRRYVGFLPDSDVQTGDWIVDTKGNRFFVVSTETLMVRDQPIERQCFISTNEKASSTTTIFNITNASGSVIGTQNQVTFNYQTSLDQLKNEVSSVTSPDKAELQQIITLLELIVDDKIPVQKGMFSKFASAMERNSWITGSVASTLLGWLMSQIH